MPLSVPGRRPHDLSRCGDRAPAEAPYLLPVCDKARILLCALSCTKNMRSQDGIVHFSTSDGALRGAAPGFRKGRCYVAASNFRCACNAAVRPSQLQPLTMSTMLARPVVIPPEGFFPFLDEESAHVRVWNLDPASSSLLSSHQPRLNCPRPPSRRGASPSFGSQAQQHGYIQIYFAPASATPPPDSAPCPCNLPCDPSARWIPHSFPCRALFYQSLSVAKRSLLPKHPVAPSTPAQNHVGGHHSPYRYGDRGGAVDSITLDPSNLIL